MNCKLRLHLIGILILVCCVSCGHSIEETVTPVVPTVAGDQFKRIVILPFADFTAMPSEGFTPGSSLYNEYYRRNALVIEALQGAMYEDGFIPAASQEDIQKYLVDHGIVKGSFSSSTGESCLQQELQEGWSDEMKEEIGEVIAQNMVSNQSRAPVKTVALNRQNLKNLGNGFGADYIVRGRIVEFHTDQIDTLNPFKTGLVPCIFKSLHRTFHGIAETEPYQQIDVDKETFEGYDRLRNMFMGAGPYVSSVIGEKQGRVPGGTVQISMLVHDVRTGDVVWFNRSEARVVTRSVWTDPDADFLFPKAIAKIVNSLSDDFATAVVSGRLAVAHKKASAPEFEESSVASFDAEVEEGQAERFANDAREAAEDAGRSAGEAGEYAERAENAAGEAQQASGEAKDAVKRASEASIKSEKIFNKIIAK